MTRLFVGRPLGILLAVGLVCSSSPRAAFGAGGSADARVDFNREIRPILSENCFFCHGPDNAERQADLRLDTPKGLFGDRGGYAAVVPGKPDESEVVRRISSADEFERMPPPDSGRTLEKPQIELIRRWIDQGAEWKQHWAYVPLQRPAVPEIENAEWPRNPIDRFILARLEQEGIEPSLEADARTLIRRLSFDLTGLPPTSEEVEAFVGQVSHLSESSGQVGNLPYEAVADRLLASPHYGERMAIHWLDLVRYADTVGYHGDQEHHISPYRDYVIKSFNENLPFDRFTIEQLAGDLLPEPTIWQKVATGYNRVLQTSHEGGVQVKEYLAKYSADRVRNASAVWMAATMGCAECHDHKYDPYTAKDFYSFAAFFADIDELQTFKGGDTSPTKRFPEMPAWNLSQYALLQQIEQEIEELRAQMNSGGSGAIAEQIAALEHERAEIEKQFQPTMITVAVEPRTIRVLPRGNWLDESGEIVEPAVPAFLPQIEKEGRATRLDLANWFVSRENPLTARVFVNRLWKLFFGEGLSGSLDDFGAQGQPPVHPELLDWLAVEFIESGWDVKHMVRLIVTSRAYRQSSLPRPELAERDPGNRLLARQSRWRLEAEFVRDNALAVSGLLVKELGGRSVRPYQPAGYYRHLNFPKREYQPDTDKHQHRRGLYMHWQRVFLHPMLKAFDAPTREECTAERPASNTPLAALVLLNDPSFIEAARGFALRILREGDDTTDERLRWAWRESLGREPYESELAALRALFEQDFAEYRNDSEAARELLSVGLAEVPEGIEPAELAAWTSVGRAVLNLNEVITRN